MDADLALKMSKFIHERCLDTPHDIGIDLANMAEDFYGEKMAELEKRIDDIQSSECPQCYRVKGLDASECTYCSWDVN